MDPRRDFGSSGLGEAEGSGLELRETGPRSPTPGLPGPARPKGWVMDFRCQCGYGVTPGRLSGR